MMHGHVYIIFCIPTAIQSILFSLIDSIYPLEITSSTKQSKSNIKCYKRRTKYAYTLFGLPSNQFTHFFYKHTTLRCYGNYVSKVYPTKCMLCAAVCN